jgi:hypothetical protein
VGVREAGHDDGRQHRADADGRVPGLDAGLRRCGAGERRTRHQQGNGTHRSTPRQMPLRCASSGVIRRANGTLLDRIGGGGRCSGGKRDGRRGARRAAADGKRQKGVRHERAKNQRVTAEARRSARCAHVGRTRGVTAARSKTSSFCASSPPLVRVAMWPRASGPHGALRKSAHCRDMPRGCGEIAPYLQQSAGAGAHEPGPGARMRHHECFGIVESCAYC